MIFRGKNHFSLKNHHKQTNKRPQEKEAFLFLWKQTRVYDCMGAFLDLAIAYLLLSASTLAFFASKFLGLLGLCLPCPSNGLFGNANSNYCLKRLLIHCPIETISYVQLSVNTKFPFDSIGAKNPDCQLNLKLIKDQNNCVDGFLKWKAKHLVAQYRGFDVVNSSVHVKKGGFDLKGKGIVNQRPRNGLRLCRKGLADYATVLPVSYDPLYANDQSHFSIDCKGNNEIECNSLPVGSGADANHFNYDKDAPVVKNLGDRASHGFQLDETLHEKKLAEKNESSYEEIKSNVQKELGYEGNEKNAIRILEQALEEEHAACAALYLELEKERSAAATAADEAMAIILRLQDEKASIEMEAWQYQRIIEEKSAYDAEEMNILKEILVRRQKDKHFLEREVEAYRRMIHIGN
ncbi:hypothetical protein ACSBR2_012860 [Camellia fascicularis]